MMIEESSLGDRRRPINGETHIRTGDLSRYFPATQRLREFIPSQRPHDLTIKVQDLRLHFCHVFIGIGVEQLILSCRFGLWAKTGQDIEVAGFPTKKLLEKNDQGDKSLIWTTDT